MFINYSFFFRTLSKLVAEVTNVLDVERLFTQTKKLLLVVEDGIKAV